MDTHRIALIRRHGRDPIACSTLQQDLRYFDASFGYIAFRRIGSTDITLGPPVCAAPDRSDLLRRFLAFSRRPIVCYVGADVIESLHDTGLHCAGMGVDRHVHLDALLAEPPVEVQGACKKAEKAGLSVRDQDFSHLGSGLQERLASISKAYLANARCTTEMSFLNSPMAYSPDGLRRGLLLSKHDREHQGVFGYAVLNPFFEDGRIAGYLLDILRFEPTRLWGVWFSAIWRIASMLAAEGKRLSLGYCPLYGVKQAPVCSSRWLDTQLQWMVRYLSSSQYVRRLHEMKSVIPGHDEPRYFASYSRSAFAAFLTLMRACGIRVTSLCTPELLRSLRIGLGAPKALRAER